MSIMEVLQAIKMFIPSELFAYGNGKYVTMNYIQVHLINMILSGVTMFGYLNIILAYVSDNISKDNTSWQVNR